LSAAVDFESLKRNDIVHRNEKEKFAKSSITR